MYVVRGHKQNDDLLMEDELAAAFLSDDESPVLTDDSNTAAPAGDDAWDENDDQDLPGQLAVDVYETDDRLVVKARTAGVNKSDLDVSISDGILTISGTLSSGDDSAATHWHVQECYWGEFSRTLGATSPSERRRSRGCSQRRRADYWFHPRSTRTSPQDPNLVAWAHDLMTRKRLEMRVVLEPKMIATGSRCRGWS